MSLTSVVAKVGVNPYWIAANAHCWFAFAVLTFFPHWWVFVAGAAIAAIKEFIFDARNEVPKQTAFDNWSDFAGYLVGLGLGAWHSGLLNR